MDREPLAEKLAAGWSLRRIAETAGVTPATVRYWVRKHGLGESAHTRRARLIRAARESGRRSIELVCPEHGLTDFVVLKPTGARCKRCRAEAVTRRRRLMKRTLVEEAGGACVLCGYDRAPEALAFHHLERDSKSFGIEQAGSSRAIALSRAEAAKCVLLCANCHAEVEAGIREASVK